MKEGSRPRTLVLVVLALLLAWGVTRIDGGHGWLGFLLILLFVALAMWGVILRIMGRDEAPVSYMVAQHWTENVLILLVLSGLVLLLAGRRVPSVLFPWDHYIYGSFFPLVALIVGRLAGMRREKREYVGMAWGAFFAAALSLQALTSGCRGALDAFCWIG